MRVLLDSRASEGKRLGVVGQAGLLLGARGLVGGYLTMGPFWNLRGKREH